MRSSRNEVTDYMKSRELVTWESRWRKPYAPIELDFLRECETGAYTGISAKQRFIEFLRMLRLIRQRPAAILDLAGNLGTARWLRAKFPSSRLTILNNCTEELGDWPSVIRADAMNFRPGEKYDLIFIGETLEHVFNPDAVIACSLLSLAPSGFIVITTPNLSCIYNRIFLLFGWTPGNYNASIRYRTGNPLFNTIGDFMITADHKSVFTWRGIVGLLNLYGLCVVASRGYDYGQKEIMRTMGARYVMLPAGKLRRRLNRFIPKKLREGMLLLCQASGRLDMERINGAILTESLWGH